jgi:hypothetical protein
MWSYTILAAVLAGKILHREADPDVADVHAVNAESAAHVAVQAARVSNQVAGHATEMNMHAQEALKHAHGALHEARTDTEGMTDAQQESLQKAEDELKIATKKLEADELEQTEWVQGTLSDAAMDEQARLATAKLEKQLHDLEVKITIEKDPATKAALETELETLKHQIETQQAAEMQQQGYQESLGKMKDDLGNMQHQVDTLEDIKNLREKISGLEPSQSTPTFSEGLNVTTVGGPTTTVEVETLSKDLADIQDMLKSLEYAHEHGQIPESSAEDKELAKELAKLRKAIANTINRQEAELQAAHVAKTADFVPVGAPGTPVRFAPADTAEAPVGNPAFPDSPTRAHSSSPVGRSSTSIDIDTEMPYGELEPFGREDTAAELTQASIMESDKMVDTIERAEVAEEKRSVFRALTRLRGAAITSYDGVARSQTGNIDEYNHLHKWRETHPLHHLADEESDVSKWAFPDNAD